MPPEVCRRMGWEPQLMCGYSRFTVNPHFSHWLKTTRKSTSSVLYFFYFYFLNSFSFLFSPSLLDAKRRKNLFESSWDLKEQELTLTPD